MTNFWTNLYKFPIFLTNVLIGFFLTTFEPIFKLLKSKYSKFIFILIIISVSVLVYKIIQKITGII
uniref:Uncharacterized protein ycf33 n=1 Tax=Polysiphonia sp. TaxID=1967842 RepID=A0A1Z1MUB9_9FLOR|nr:hypothetical protein [Polysiphonia sp.]